MPTEVIMPKVDMDMAAGRIMAWHVAEGGSVAKGDPLFDIETDKAAMEIEAPASGILRHASPEGTEVPIGTPCAWLYAEDEAVGEPPVPGTHAGGADADAPADADEAPAPDETPAPGDGRTAPDYGSRGPAPGDGREANGAPAREDAPASAGDDTSTEKPRATPRARALAAEAGIDLRGIAGSGPRARVQAGDVREALEVREAPAPAEARETPAPAPATFRSETGALSVTRTKGGTGTPVVLLHGFASDATSWAPVEAHIKHRPLVRIDLPGHGKSPRLALDGFGDLVREVRRAFDDLGEDRVHLVGHSLGGALAVALADTRAKRLASLTLVAPAGLGPEVNGDLLNGICRATRAESLAPWLRGLVANEDIVTDNYVRTVMAGRSDPDLRAAQAAMADVLFPDGVQAFDLRAALARISVPGRVIWGRRDEVIPWRHALRAPGRMALHLFDGVGHMPQVECANEVGAILADAV